VIFLPFAGQSWRRFQDWQVGSYRAEKDSTLRTNDVCRKYKAACHLAKNRRGRDFFSLLTISSVVSAVLANRYMLGSRW
jgi:hypothetical protein